MGSFSTAAKNSILDALGNAVTLPFSGAVYAKLHLGDPGSAGTANPAGETSRKLVGMAAAGSGAMVSDAETRWNGVSTSETYSWVSFWDAAAAGNFLGSDDLPSAKAVVAGDNFFIAAGDISLSI